jgi:hypothetical protein
LHKQSGTNLWDLRPHTFFPTRFAQSRPLDPLRTQFLLNSNILCFCFLELYQRTDNYKSGSYGCAHECAPLTLGPGFSWALRNRQVCTGASQDSVMSAIRGVPRVRPAHFGTRILLGPGLPACLHGSLSVISASRGGPSNAPSSLWDPDSPGSWATGMSAREPPRFRH